MVKDGRQLNNALDFCVRVQSSRQAERQKNRQTQCRQVDREEVEKQIHETF